MSPWIRILSCVFLGTALACGGADEPLEVREPDPEVPDRICWDGSSDALACVQGSCGAPIPLSISPGSGIVVGSFLPMQEVEDECLGAAKEIVFRLDVPVDGGIELDVWASFPSSASLKASCDGPAGPSACLHEVGKQPLASAVTAGQSVYLSLAAPGDLVEEGSFKISLTYHPPRQSGETCSPTLPCGTGLHCSSEGIGFCTEDAQVVDFEVLRGGPTGDDAILRFESSDPHAYVVSFELQITDSRKQTRTIHHTFLSMLDDENREHRSFLHNVLRDMQDPLDVRLRLFNGGWGDFKAGQVGLQPIVDQGESCDPQYIFDRCEPSSACHFGEGGATCQALEDVRLDRCEVAETLEVDVDTFFWVEKSGRGVWELPAACGSHPGARSFPEQVLRLSLDSDRANVHIQDRAGFGTIFAVYRNCPETGDGLVACFTTSGTIPELPAGDYVLLIKGPELDREPEAFNIRITTDP